MKYFNNLPEKIKLQKEAKELAAKIAGEYPINFVLNQSTKRIYNFAGTLGVKEDKQITSYPFLNTREFRELKHYPIKQLFYF